MTSRLIAVLALASLAVLGMGGLGQRPPVYAQKADEAGPVRVVDTRMFSIPTIIDGIEYRDRPVYDGETITVRIGPDPVVLNTTAVLSSGAGFATVYPCLGGRPVASNLNFVPGQIIANTTIASPDTNGDACIYFQIVGAAGPNMADVVVDRYSSVPAHTFEGLRPVRLYDSRSGWGAPADNLRRAGSVTMVRVGNPNQAVVLNVTSTGPTTPGIFTVYPCGTSTPNTSNLNYEARETRAAMVVVKSSPYGEVCVYTTATTDLVVDLLGRFEGGGAREFFTPVRLMDTRDQFGGPHGRYFVLDLTRYSAASGDIVRSNGRAAVLNVTAVAPFDHGFVTVYPCAEGTVPTTSILNYPVERFATPNSVIIQPDEENHVCFYSESRVHLVVDLFGFIEPPHPAPESESESESKSSLPHPVMSTLMCHEISDARKLSNDWRAARGRPPLTFSQDMYNGAVWWATYLVTHREFRHSTTNEIAKAGYQRRLGEVVGMLDTVTAWQNSSAHFDIITDGRYNEGAFAYCEVEWTDRTKRLIGVGWVTFRTRGSSTVS